MTYAFRSFLAVLLFLFVPFIAKGLAEENPGSSQPLAAFEEIKTRLANVEKQQQEIVAKDNEILAKLDQLRIWVHRK